MERVLMCNQCGRQIERNDAGYVEDFFEGNKEWGYFSMKDFTRHEFCICENCYDEWIAGFKIPVTIREKIEI